MPDYRAPVPWEVGRTDQVMTARWLNRVVENIHMLHGAAYAGGQCFRSVILRVPYLRGDPWNVPAVVWQGWYRHVNSDITALYNLYRFSTGIAIDNAEDPFRPGTFYDPTGDRYYVEDQAEDTTVWFQIEDDPEGAPGTYTDLVTPVTFGSNVADSLNQTFTADVTGLGLTYGALYRVRVVGQNGAINVVRLYGEGAQDTYPTLPPVTDGWVLTPEEWNTFLEASAYCKQLVDSPAPGFSGVYPREGNADNDTTFTTVPFIGRIKHTGAVLRYRIGVIGSGVEQSAGTDWPGDWTGDGVARLMAVAGGAPVFVDGVNEIKPETGYAGPAPAGEFDNGARIRILKYSPGDESYLNWRWVEGDWTVSIPGVSVGDWYDVFLETQSNTAEGFSVRVDFVGELADEAAANLTSVAFTPNLDVMGDSGAGARVEYVADDLAVVKTACDRIIQPLTPDPSAWPSRDTPNVHMFARQRPLLLWAGGDADNPITLSYGSPTAYTTVELGYTEGAVVDLASVDGLDIGTLYWLSPREYVAYAVEVFPT